MVSVLGLSRRRSLASGVGLRRVVTAPHVTSGACHAAIENLSCGSPKDLSALMRQWFCSQLSRKNEFNSRSST